MQTPKASTNAVLFAISLALSIYQRSKPDFRLSDKKRKKVMYLYNFENHINSTAINHFTCNYNFTNQLSFIFS